MINPLFPKGTKSGIVGAWQQAAFMDDTDEMERDFKRKKAAERTKTTDSVFSEGAGSGLFGTGREAAFQDDVDKTYRDYKRIAPSGKLTRAQIERLLRGAERSKREKVASRAMKERNRVTQRNFKEKKRELKQLKGSGEITKREYRKAKRKLVKETDKANWQSYKEYLKETWF